MPFDVERPRLCVYVRVKDNDLGVARRRAQSSRHWVALNIPCRGPHHLVDEPIAASGNRCPWSSPGSTVGRGSSRTCGSGRPGDRTFGCRRVSLVVPTSSYTRCIHLPASGALAVVLRVRVPHCAVSHDVLCLCFYGVGGDVELKTGVVCCRARVADGRYWRSGAFE